MAASEDCLLELILLLQPRGLFHWLLKEAVAQTCSTKHVFLKILQSAQKKTYWTYWEIFKNTYFLFNTSGSCFWTDTEAVAYKHSTRSMLENSSQNFHGKTLQPVHFVNDKSKNLWERSP